MTVGASGAIFGILGALFVLERRGNIATGGQIAGLIVLNLIFTFAISNISVGGHIGGLIGGVILMWLLLHTRRSMLQSVGRHRGRDRRELDRRVRQGSRLQLAATREPRSNVVRTRSRVSAAGCDVRARAGLGQRGLCGGEPRQRNPERRAGDVVEAE